MGALTAERGWTALLGAVLVYEIACDDGEMLSHGMDRLMERHPVWPRIAVAVVALHLTRLIPRQVDPLAGAFHATRGISRATTWLARSLKG